jgi:hypothetical protein
MLVHFHSSSTARHISYLLCGSKTCAVIDPAVMSGSISMRRRTWG